MVSRQRLWQIESVARGNCQICGKARKHYANYCDECGVKHRKVQRDRHGHNKKTASSSGRKPFVEEDTSDDE